MQAREQRERERILGRTNVCVKVVEEREGASSRGAAARARLREERRMVKPRRLAVAERPGGKGGSRTRGIDYEMGDIL